MVDRDIANAITIAMIANVIEVTVILFITFFSFIGESIRLVFRTSVWLAKELFTCYKVRYGYVTFTLQVKVYLSDRGHRSVTNLL